jgi:L-threonylcarbamoyladenylate synthase
VNLADLQRTAAILEAGGVAGVPTEGVWGLSSRADCLDAVERILDIKKRAPSKGLIILISDFSELADWYACPIHDEAVYEAGRPSTWVVPVTDACPPILTGGRSSLAVRQVKMPLLRRLVEQVGPIVSTSANRSGRPACQFRWQVMLQLARHLDYVSRARTQGYHKPSTIRDMKSGAVLRS